MLAMYIKTKGGPIPLFSDTFDTKYRAKKSTDTDSDTDPSPHSILRDYIHFLCEIICYN